MGFVNSSIIAQTPTNVTKTLYNEIISLADTEQSLVLPIQILGYMIKVRDCTADLKLTHVSGESGTKYLTIPKGAVHTDEHQYSNLTLYFQSPVQNAVVEVVVWS